MERCYIWLLVELITQFFYFQRQKQKSLFLLYKAHNQFFVGLFWVFFHSSIDYTKVCEYVYLFPLIYFWFMPL